MKRFMSKPKNLEKKSHHKRGFALVITLSLISFVFLLVITLISQIRMDLSYSDVRENQILAKAHARMGMMIAIGEIQKHLGPDMRVSATADIYDDRIESEKDYLLQGYPINQSSDTSPKLYGAGTNKIELGQRQWTGVWKQRGGWAENKLATPPLPENRDDGKALTKSWSYDSSYDPHPAVEQAWLVSGNEGWGRKLGIMKGQVINEFIEVPDGIIIDDEGKRILNNPQGGIYGEDENPWVDHKKVVGKLDATQSYHHPLFPLEEPSGVNQSTGSDQTTWLLKHPVLDDEYDPGNPDHAKTWTDYLVAEPVKVKKTALHLHKDQRNEDADLDWMMRNGSYAYWVGDEGVKTKINVMEPFMLEDDGSMKQLLEGTNKLKVASEPNIEGGSYGFDFTPSTKKDDEQRKDLITSQSAIDLLEQDSSSQVSVVNPHYHSITTDSFGVLADVRTGGLKRDLSLAFSLNQETSEAWKKDFADNFIFRDRVRAMKNIPLEPNTMRNQWFVSANDATVDDPDALLAGPPWSVLADFHNLQATDGLLQMQAPDQFPRTVGDNALIFGRRAPNSPRGAFSNARSAYPFFNCFSSSVRKIRPEPKNHSILPVFVKARLSISPVATNDPGNFCLGIYPSITLWNPYNENLVLKDLYVEIPFCDKNEQPAPFECSVTQVDFKEYDLYRKWWAYIYGDFNSTFELKDSDISTAYRPYLSGYIKNWREPWGLYNFKSGSNQIGGAENEPALIDQFLKGGNPPFDQNIDFTNWNNRIPPDSMYGIKMDGNRIYHENPKDGVGDYTFTFHSLKKKSVSFDKLSLKILNESDSSSMVVMEPGEVVTFAAFSSSNGGDVQSNQPADSNPDPPAFINLTRKTSITVEKGYVWDSGFSLDRDACAFLFKMGGLAGYLRNTAENYDPQGMKSNSAWSSADGFIEPKSFTLWKGPPNEDSSIELTRLTEPRAVSLDEGSDVKFSTNKYLKQNLEESAQGAYQENLFGLGWEVSLKMPGDLDMERIPLVEFNTRALVHSTQHGQGSWLKGSKLLRPSHYAAPPQLALTPPQSSFSYTVNGNLFAFNTTSGDYAPSSPKSTPDFYAPPSTTPDLLPNINNLTDPNTRANALGFNIKTPSYNFDENDNPDFLFDPKVPSSWGQERIGFFSEITTTSAPYSNKFSHSTHAVLFEIPKGKILSILQYRHANLNNYLHGSSYSLGNSYASTQVARHRSWGRVQNIEKRPHSEGGLTSVEGNMVSEEEAITFYKNLLGDFLATQKGLDNFINWNIDSSQGFAPWRRDGADQLNHQNTTIDHSYYQNRALSDGFFLSGSAKVNDFSKENTNLLGQRYRPLLWDHENQTPADLSSDLEVVGNHRLVAYLRNNSWETAQTSFGLKSKEKGFSTTKDSEYRYHTLAGDLLLDGAFNINSTSVDAWVAQLSSLRGLAVENANVGSEETPVIRLLEEPDANDWNKLRVLTDPEIESLAKALVKQVKLRGPFLSFSDFVNRRLALGPMDSDPSKAKGTRVNFVQYDLEDWANYAEDRFTAQGLRGAIQSAIAEAGLNDEGSSWSTNDWIPEIPQFRYDLNSQLLFDSSFGIKASALSLFNEVNPEDTSEKFFFLKPDKTVPRTWGVGSKTQTKLVPVGDVNGDGRIDSIRDDTITYPSTTFGEAPENLLAVEHLATGANKPGWVMQSDLLSPLMPVTSARSDTFIIRVMGETNKQTRAKAWAELVVQRTPDYVKPDLDAPHHRPHEPIKDTNLNGYWDDGLGEHWIDLNRNGDTQPRPDLPGVGELGKEKDYRDGMLSDLKLQMDSQEEDSSSSAQISYLGINQRFGRKFKIIRFRWLREDEV
jgi:hypothetical protein